jgi:hypothetical protein
MVVDVDVVVDRVMIYHLIKMIFFVRKQNVLRNRILMVVVVVVVVVFHHMNITMKQHNKLYQVIVLS